MTGDLVYFQKLILTFCAGIMNSITTYFCDFGSNECMAFSIFDLLNKIKCWHQFRKEQYQKWKVFNQSESFCAENSMLHCKHNRSKWEKRQECKSDTITNEEEWKKILFIRTLSHKMFWLNGKNRQFSHFIKLILAYAVYFMYAVNKHLRKYFEYRNNGENNHNNDNKFTTIKLKIVFDLIMHIIFNLDVRICWCFCVHGMLNVFQTDNKVFSISFFFSREHTISARFDQNYGIKKNECRESEHFCQIHCLKPCLGLRKGQACNELF